jgi:hypothetical protein
MYVSMRPLPLTYVWFMRAKGRGMEEEVSQTWARRKMRFCGADNVGALAAQHERNTYRKTHTNTNAHCSTGLITAGPSAHLDAARCHPATRHVSFWRRCRQQAVCVGADVDGARLMRGGGGRPGVDVGGFALARGWESWLRCVDVQQSAWRVGR